MVKRITKSPIFINILVIYCQLITGEHQFIMYYIDSWSNTDKRDIKTQYTRFHYILDY
jgi:hypothetical protein